MLEFFSSRFLLYLAGDALGVAFRHQHHITTWQGQKGGQSGAFSAPLLLDDLHQQFLATTQHVVDARPALGLAVRVGFVEGRMDLADLQESGPLSTIIDKGRLQTGFYPDHDRLVDIAFGLLFSCDFNIEFA